MLLAPTAERWTSASHTSDDPIRLWDLADLQPRAQLAGHTSAVIAACWDPSGRLLASIGDTDCTVHVWDTTADPPRCRVLPVIPPGKNWLHYIAFTPDGRYLATANPDGTIYILKLAEPGAMVEITAADR